MSNLDNEQKKAELARERKTQLIQTVLIFSTYILMPVEGASLYSVWIWIRWHW